MEYLDPRKQLRHRILLFAGYVCIGVAIVIATLILVYQAYGFGLGKDGGVTQNGLIFFSSQPPSADIYLNGQRNKVRTNARLSIPEGIYDVSIARNGYLDWRRKIELLGGEVKHFDYPFLIPKQLSTENLKSYLSIPQVQAQSPDHRWLLIKQPGNSATFDLYDLKSKAKQPAVFALPSGVAPPASGKDKWQFIDWADDNRHVLLLRQYDGKKDYLLVDRSEPDRSQILNATLSSETKEISLRDDKYDLYYLHDPKTNQLQTASLSEPQPVKLIDDVIKFQPAGRNTVLYATGKDADKGTVNIKLRVGNDTYLMRSFPAGTTYLLDLAQYSRKLYMALGTTAGNKIYVYEDPVGQRRREPDLNLVPIQVLHVNKPNHLSFSASAQFVMTENGRQFGVYDIENEVGHSYKSNETLDAPQKHATWMDGHRLLYVTHGRLQVFDYDYQNKHGLVAASPDFLPAFGPDFKHLYVLAPQPKTGHYIMTQTSLRTPEDL